MHFWNGTALFHWYRDFKHFSFDSHTIAFICSRKSVAKPPPTTVMTTTTTTTTFISRCETANNLRPSPKTFGKWFFFLLFCFALFYVSLVRPIVQTNKLYHSVVFYFCATKSTDSWVYIRWCRILRVCKYFIHYAHDNVACHHILTEGFNIRTDGAAAVAAATAADAVVIVCTCVCVYRWYCWFCYVDSVLPVYLASNLLTSVKCEKEQASERTNEREWLLIQWAGNTHISFPWSHAHLIYIRLGK